MSESEEKAYEPSRVELVSSLVQAVRDHARTMARLSKVEGELVFANAQLVALRDAVREYADSRGVNIGDDDDEWWKGYRNAQRVALHDAQEFKRHALADPEDSETK